jgi:hypothetical protein
MKFPAMTVGKRGIEMQFQSWVKRALVGAAMLAADSGK